MHQKGIITKDLFAYFGRVVFQIQAIEKGILNLILFKHLDKNITKSRYDEILFEKSKLSFGPLKRELKDLQVLSNDDFKKIEDFHNKRDFLVHRYWWERAIEFANEEARLSLFNELQGYTDYFDEIIERIEDLSIEFITKNNLDIGKIISKYSSFDKTPPIKEFRILSKNETIIELFQYKNHVQSIIPIFKLEDNTFWTIGEIGLTQYTETVNERNKAPINELLGIFPIKQFNARPKALNAWNYELDLKRNGLKLKVERKKEDSAFKWKITK